MRLKSLFSSLRILVQKYSAKLKAQVKNNEIRTATLNSLPFWIASVVTGLLAVFYSEIFHFAETFLYESSLSHNPWVFVFTPLAFIVSWYLVYRFSPEASGSGIPQLMVGIEYANKKDKKGVVNKLLSVRVIIVKILSSTVLLLGGGAIGREGPTIQVAGSVFNTINNIIPKYWPKISHRLMLISGGAAGLAAAFNTPLGGIVFAIEELGKTHLNSIKNHLFVAIIIAGITSKLLLGPYLYLGSPAIPEMKSISFFYVILTAAIAGYFGFFFTKIIMIVVRFKAKFSTFGRKLFWVIFMGGLFATLLFFTGQQTVGSGRHLMTDLLFDSSFVMDWFSFPARFFGTIITYVCGGAGGVFAPSLAIGATLGETIVTLLDIQEFRTLIVIVGMIGFMSGVTHSPFTSFILVLEMTSAQTSVFPMMLAAVIGYVISRSCSHKSLYDHLTANYMKQKVEQEPEETVTPSN